MSGDKKAKPALAATLAIALFGTTVLAAGAQSQPTGAPQCTPGEKSDIEDYARTVRKFKRIGADQIKVACEAIEAGEGEASASLKERLGKFNEFAKDVNPVLKKWFGTALPEDLDSKIDINAASRYCRAQKGQAEQFLEDEAKRVEAELDRCGISI
jgi:hypothetical protein